MQSTKPPYTSIRSVPAGAILGNSGGATAAAQALDASTVRTVIGLGTAATAAIAATGTADRVQKRSGTGNTLVDSLFGVTDTTGIASLMGTTACYRAYDSAGTKYVEAKHDGTSGQIGTSTGALQLTAAGGASGTQVTIDEANSRLYLRAVDLRLQDGYRVVQMLPASYATRHPAGWKLVWTDDPVRGDLGTADTGVARNAAGVLETNNGTAGTLATHTAILRPAPYTFATVPTASSNTGSTIRITDRSNRQAYSDGTNWRWTADDVIIS